MAEGDETERTPVLDPVERRVVGALIEKQLATPQNYPLTLNALRLACNQSSNRDPVVAYDDHTVEDALGRLRQRGLTRIVYSTSNRAAKYRHVLDEVLHLIDEELAVLAVLLLRGPQTVGEVKGRTERLAPLGSLGDVQAMLDRLAQRPTGALVVRLERRPGQKDVRWAHLLAGDEDRVDHGAPASEDGPVAPGPSTDPGPSSTLSAPAGAGAEPAADRPSGRLTGVPAADRAGPGTAGASDASASGSGPSGSGAGGSAGGATAPVDGALAAVVAEVEALRAEVTDLRSRLDEVRADLDAFRAEFS